MGPASCSILARLHAFPATHADSRTLTHAGAPRVCRRARCEERRDWRGGAGGQRERRVEPPAVTPLIGQPGGGESIEPGQTLIL